MLLDASLEESAGREKGVGRDSKFPDQKVGSTHFLKIILLHLFIWNAMVWEEHFGENIKFKI